MTETQAEYHSPAHEGLGAPPTQTGGLLRPPALSGSFPALALLWCVPALVEDKVGKSKGGNQD